MGNFLSYTNLVDAVACEREAQARMSRDAQIYLDLWSREATALSCLNPEKTKVVIYGLGLRSAEDLAALINKRSKLALGYEAYVRRGRRTLEPDFIGIRAKAVVPIP